MDSSSPKAFLACQGVVPSLVLEPAALTHPGSSAQSRSLLLAAVSIHCLATLVRALSVRRRADGGPTCKVQSLLPLCRHDSCPLSRPGGSVPDKNFFYRSAHTRRRGQRSGSDVGYGCPACLQSMLPIFRALNIPNNTTLQNVRGVENFMGKRWYVMCSWNNSFLDVTIVSIFVFVLLYGLLPSQSYQRVQTTSPEPTRKVVDVHEGTVREVMGTSSKRFRCEPDSFKGFDDMRRL